MLGMALYLRDAVPFVGDRLVRTAPEDGLPDSHPACARVRSSVEALAASGHDRPSAITVVAFSSPVLMCTGIDRPSIVVSTGTLDRLDDRALEAALAHEFAHLATRDPLIGWWLMAARTVQFFNPVVQILARQAVQELSSAAPTSPSPRRDAPLAWPTRCIGCRSPATRIPTSTCPRAGAIRARACWPPRIAARSTPGASCCSRAPCPRPCRMRAWRVGLAAVARRPCCSSSWCRHHAQDRAARGWPSSSPRPSSFASRTPCLASRSACRGVWTRASDVAELERASGLRMPVPAYFPDSLDWPPAELRMHTGGSAAIWCRQRPAGPVALIVATARAGPQGIADAVLPLVRRTAARRRVAGRAARERLPRQGRGWGRVAAGAVADAGPDHSGPVPWYPRRIVEDRRQRARESAVSPSRSRWNIKGIQSRVGLLVVLGVLPSMLVPGWIAWRSLSSLADQILLARLSVATTAVRHLDDVVAREWSKLQDVATGPGIAVVPRRCRKPGPRAGVAQDVLPPRRVDARDLRHRHRRACPAARAERGRGQPRRAAGSPRSPARRAPERHRAGERAERPGGVPVRPDPGLDGPGVGPGGRRGRSPRVAPHGRPALARCRRLRAPRSMSSTARG